MEANETTETIAVGKKNSPLEVSSTLRDEPKIDERKLYGRQKPLGKHNLSVEPARRIWGYFKLSGSSKKKDFELHSPSWENIVQSLPFGRL